MELLWAYAELNAKSAAVKRLENLTDEEIAKIAKPTWVESLKDFVMHPLSPSERYYDVMMAREILQKGTRDRLKLVCGDQTSKQGYVPYSYN